MDLDRLEPQWLPEWPRGRGIGSQYLQLGVSDSYTAVADLAFVLRWRERRDDAPIVESTVEYMADLDVHDDLLLVSGLRRNVAGTVGGDGSTAWIGSMRQGLGSLRPVLPFRSKKAIEDCAGFGLTAVRFLRDGSYLVVPGAEPGVYLYGVEGRLVRTWDTKLLDIEVDCNLSTEQRSLATNPDARQAWLNARRIVDDAIALDVTPAIIVRSRSATETRWDLITLRDGGHDVHPLPFTSPSPWAHLAADARDGKIAFVISDVLRDRAGGAPPRLVIMQWPPH